MKRLSIWPLTVAFFFLVTSSCSKTSPLAPDSKPSAGQLSFTMDTLGDTENHVTGGTVTITKGTTTNVQPVAVVNHAGAMTIPDVQVGQWSIAVELYDNKGADIYSGTGQAIVIQNQTTLAHIQVNQNTG